MNEPSDQPPPFPIAEAKPSRKRSFDAVSRMWIVTLVCALLAVGVTWYSIDASGPTITIRFPEGHGIKAGDPIRHRGIEVGRVTNVRLNEELSAISVQVELEEEAEAIASDGSRFWIVRPQIDLTGISGLETAIGSKYIAVIPGDPGTPRSDFAGLSTRPPDSLGQSGIEVVLRGEDRFGVNPESPVTWRGFEVGQVISSKLSPNALHVDTRIRVAQPYRRLLSRNSKFWVTSGVEMDFGITGLEVSTGTLDTITRGGIAFITPRGGESENEDVRSGDMFTLHPKGDDGWIEDAAALNLLETAPPPITRVAAAWTQKRFGITRSLSVVSSALAIEGTGGPFLLLPEDLVSVSDDSIEGSYQLQCEGNNGNKVALDTTELPEDPSPYLALVVLDPDQKPAAKLVDRSRFRRAESTEDCYVIRRLWHADEDKSVMVETIGKHELSAQGEIWRTTLTRLGRDTWHGAPVLSAEDEKIIGMLIVDDEGISVALIKL
jgi:paraquat-inducible protein B